MNWHINWMTSSMEKYITPIFCVLLAACGTSQQTTQQLTQPPLQKTEDTISITEDAAPLIEKDIETMVSKKTSETAKTKSPMQKVASPDPQIMRVPESEPVLKATSASSANNIPVQKPEASVKIINHSPWNTLLKKHVSDKGVVNYKGFIKDKASFRAYLKEVSQTVPQENWTKNQKLAYWMNAYNAFTIKLIIDNYPLQSIKDIKKPWDLRFFKIGEKWYNLNDIEHRVLRKMGDPRIHFGINCASFSCPPLLNKAFTPENVNTELQKLAVAFINDPARNTINASTIEISKIFQWFGKDFKTDGSLIDFLNQYAKTKISSDAKQRFMEYNWNLNE